MKRYHLLLVASACALLLSFASTVAAGVPTMQVTVIDASGKVGFKGATDSNGVFATPNLQPGHYVVQFNAKNAVTKSNQYLMVISAGRKKVIATDVSGGQFSGGGVAMRINVGPGLKITGQIANDQRIASAGSVQYKIVDGQRFVWEQPETGSNIGGRWVAASLAPARQITRWNQDILRRYQDRGGEGSMAEWDHHMGEGSY
jgi:hypothetical protein